MPAHEEKIYVLYFEHEDLFDGVLLLLRSNQRITLFEECFPFLLLSASEENLLRPYKQMDGVTVFEKVLPEAVINQLPEKVQVIAYALNIIARERKPVYVPPGFRLYDPEIDGGWE